MKIHDARHTRAAVGVAVAFAVAFAVNQQDRHEITVEPPTTSMATQESQKGTQQAPAAQASVDLPPAMAEIKSQSVDEVLAEMNRMPLFMTTLDETDGEGGENMMLEALRAMAYEGTRAEIAENFRQQGNECARAKQWTDAKEFYDKAIAALKGPQGKPDPDAEGPGVIEVELDEQEEAKKEKVTEEACYVNRALCNLEKSKLPGCACTWSASASEPPLLDILTSSSMQSHYLHHPTPSQTRPPNTHPQKTTAPASTTAPAPSA